MDGKQTTCKGCTVVVKVENNVFANSLMSATIQYSDKRERSDD